MADFHGPTFRNIVSLIVSQDLFDDLSNDPQEWALAQQVESSVKPPPYQSDTPVIHRPFEDAIWFNAIGWPFKHWQASRFSDGHFGIWYGCDTVEASVYETAYHWVRGFLADAGFEQESVVAERRVYQVDCDAALVDLRTQWVTHPDLFHTSDYHTTQWLGARLHHEGHPGLITRSVRQPAGQSLAILNPQVLSHPRHNCYLTYRLSGSCLAVEKPSGRVWFEIATQSL